MFKQISGLSLNILSISLDGELSSERLILRHEILKARNDAR